LGEVMDGIGSFPATMDLTEQGLFALGYYHQRQEFFKKAEPSESEQGDEE
jgi:CRISPR-associated protein Csd1